ncbi:hypothetical protein GCM10020258_10380 [Sphingomonas yabuuchiae]
MVEPPRAPPAPEFLGIVDDRARQAGIIDAAMLEEALVLRRQEGTDKERRIFIVGQLDPALARIGLDRGAVDSAHMGRQRRLIGLERVDRGQVADEHEPEHAATDRREQRKDGEHPHPPAAPERATRRFGGFGGEKVSTAMALRGFV